MITVVCKGFKAGTGRLEPGRTIDSGTFSNERQLLNSGFLRAASDQEAADYQRPPVKTSEAAKDSTGSSSKRKKTPARKVKASKPVKATTSKPKAAKRAATKRPAPTRHHNDRVSI